MLFKVVIQKGIRTNVPILVLLNVKEVVTPSMDHVYMDVQTQTLSQLTVSVNRFKYFFFIVKDWIFRRFVYLNVDNG